MTIRKNEIHPKGQKKVALGRGLDALFPDIGEMDQQTAKDFFQCDVDLIRPNPFQPRIRFSEEELAELKQSIQTQGILQPLIVRKADTGYELIAGERRLRASRMAGLRQVPVVVRNVPDTELLELSIVENIQRENLNPMEEAEAFRRLMNEFHLTQDQVAGKVGKSRSAVANFLRLVQLPEPIKKSLSEGRISMGHARALLGVETAAQQLAAWQVVVGKELSVRETEALIKRLKKEKEKRPAPSKSSDEIYFESLAEELSRHFGTKILIKRQGQKGKLEIEFYSNDDLDRLLMLLKKD
ncbi:MAG: ParB/RepB/Spo0J family partition protein [Thermodesulfobacteriota bacterium]